MYCPQCGTKAEENARFCAKCGRALSDSSEQPRPALETREAGPYDPNYRSEDLFYVPSHLVWAILSTVCCCPPTGIVSIVYAAQVNGLVAAGDFARARGTVAFGLIRQGMAWLGMAGHGRAWRGTARLRGARHGMESGGCNRSLRTESYITLSTQMQQYRARQASENAKTWAWVSFGLGIFVGILYFAINLNNAVPAVLP